MLQYVPLSRDRQPWLPSRWLRYHPQCAHRWAQWSWPDGFVNTRQVWVWFTIFWYISDIIYYIQGQEKPLGDPLHTHDPPAPMLPPPIYQSQLGPISILNPVLSWTVPGCVTCHTCHASVTDFRPILGNPVEVTHVTSPGLYIFSHAKGTYFPLTRISSLTPPYHFWDNLAGPVTEGRAQLCWPLRASLSPREPVITSASSLNWHEEEH